ncbi:hypothetical protein TWF694_011120 [Orbilia ellipsospora]|uniref:Ankyrin repeat protein n=1 Tax=Orbilia ellipsospora TaxID=2528407 RepID=A0AAV9X9B6_9PEZI
MSTSTIHDLAWEGTLTEKDLLEAEHLQAIDEVHSKRQLTPLGAAVLKGDVSTTRLLLQHGANVNKRSGTRTPLWIAVSRMQKEKNIGPIVNILLEAGADPNLSSESDNNSAPLLNAIKQNRKPEVIAKLVDHGASLTAKDKFGASAESLANRKSDKIKSALFANSWRINRYMAAGMVTGLVLFVVAWSNTTPSQRRKIALGAAILAAGAVTANAGRSTSQPIAQSVNDNPSDEAVAGSSAHPATKHTAKATGENLDTSQPATRAPQTTPDRTQPTIENIDSSIIPDTTNSVKPVKHEPAQSSSTTQSAGPGDLADLQTKPTPNSTNKEAIDDPGQSTPDSTNHPAKGTTKPPIGATTQTTAGDATEPAINNHSQAAVDKPSQPAINNVKINGNKTTTENTAGNSEETTTSYNAQATAGEPIQLTSGEIQPTSNDITSNNAANQNAARNTLESATNNISKGKPDESTQPTINDPQHTTNGATIQTSAGDTKEPVIQNSAQVTNDETPQPTTGDFQPINEDAATQSTTTVIQPENTTTQPTVNDIQLTRDDTTTQPADRNIAEPAIENGIQTIAEEPTQPITSEIQNNGNDASQTATSSDDDDDVDDDGDGDGGNDGNDDCDNEDETALPGAVLQRFGMSGDFGEDMPPELKELMFEQSVENFKKGIDDYIKKTKLDRFFPPDNPFLKTVVRKALYLEQDPDNTLDVKDLTKLSLYQTVLYLDDSGSMRKGTRHNDLRDLVRRIAGIATRLLPDDEGVELRFMNSPTDTSYSKPSLDKIDNIISDLRMWGWTPIGTNLKAKVLIPLVYKRLRVGGDKLDRPMLISIITDGHPEGPQGRKNQEKRDSLKEAILECRRRLEQCGFEPNTVLFQISQIGAEEEATKFLESLRLDEELDEVLYCTTDQLDTKYKELQLNHQRLEQYLFSTLLGPIIDADPT